MSETVRGASETGDGLKTRLRCESCGYDIAGIGVGGRCSECGLAVIESMPERRVGTPWQRGRGIAAYFATLGACIIRPRVLLRTATNKPSRNHEMILWNALFSSAIPFITFGFLVLVNADIEDPMMALLFGALVGGLVLFLCVFFAILVGVLLLFFPAWYAAVLTVGCIPQNNGLLAASVASAWLVLGSGVFTLLLILIDAGRSSGVPLFPSGLLIGWGGYLVMCYRSLVWLRHANFP